MGHDVAVWVESKRWGSVVHVFVSPTVAIDRIFVNRGGRSSKHCHLHKSNMLYVEEGRLRVDIWKVGHSKQVLLSSHVLSPGDDPLVVLPSVYHQFQALSDVVVAVEVYWPLHDFLADDDIVRIEGT